MDFIGCHESQAADELCRTLGALIQVLKLQVGDSLGSFP